MSDSIDLMREKREFTRETKAENRKQILEELAVARQKAKALGDSDLMRILDWVAVLYPFKATATSIITFLCGRRGNLTVNDDPADDELEDSP